jgi:hypothetical protein
MKSLLMYSSDVLVDHTRRTDGPLAVTPDIMGERRTLQQFLHPPALSSAAFGGLHFHDHSKDTDWLPPVE